MNVKKFEFGGVSEFAEILPIYGTYKSGERLLKNPSWGRAGEFAFNLGSDAATIFGVGALAKGVKAINLAKKATKTLRATEDAYDVYDGLIKADKLSKRIKHNKNVINSLSLDNRGTGFNLITDRIKQNKNLIRQRNNYISTNNKLYDDVIQAYKPYNYYWDQAEELPKLGKEIIGLTTLGKIPVVPTMHLINGTQHGNQK